MNWNETESKAEYLSISGIQYALPGFHFEKI